VNIWEYGRRLGKNKVVIKDNEIFVEEDELEFEDSGPGEKGEHTMTIKFNNFSVLTDAIESSNPLAFDIGNNSIRIENAILVSRDAAERLGILKQLDSGLKIQASGASL